ncbi:MAG TPA: hypothetical protein VNR61_05400 [Niallia sp.]|nr:hypothetical protein [Niallia sp.]
MWVITVFNVYERGNHITMFEFDTEKEAKKHFEKMQGCKILSEIVCDHTSSLVTT